MEKTTKKPRFFFDYIFYRVAKFYFRWDGSFALTAHFSVGMVQTLLLVDLFGLVTKLTIEKQPIQNLVPYLKWASVFIFILLSFLSYLKYRHKYLFFRTYWEGEPKRIRVCKGILVVLSLIIPWILVIVIANLI